MSDDTAIEKTSLRLQRGTIKRVKQYGLDHDLTFTAVVTEALNEYFSKRSSREKK